MRVCPPGLSPSCEARVASARVQTGKPADVGGAGRVEQLLGPRERLEQLHGEAHQRGMGGDVRRDLHLAARRAPPEPGTKVGQLEIDPIHGVAPPRTVPVLPASRGLASEARRVPISHSFERSRLRQPILGELADRLEEAVSRARRRVVGDDE